MTPSLDNLFGIHEKALRIRSKRAEILASNMANADTPNFKARDLDFRAALKDAGDASGSMVPAVALKTSHPMHMPDKDIPTPGVELKYRNPYQPSLDGNTVETDVEQGVFAENAVRYQATLTFLNGRIRGLMLAITGGQ